MVADVLVKHVFPFRNYGSSRSFPGRPGLPWIYGGHGQFAEDPDPLAKSSNPWMVPKRSMTSGKKYTHWLEVRSTQFLLFFLAIGPKESFQTVVYMRFFWKQKHLSKRSPRLPKDTTTRTIHKLLTPPHPLPLPASLSSRRSHPPSYLPQF